MKEKQQTILFLGDFSQWNFIWETLLTEQALRKENKHVDNNLLWQTRDHDIFPVCKMADSHIQNSLKYMMREGRNVGWMKTAGDKFLEDL